MTTQNPSASIITQKDLIKIYDPQNKSDSAKIEGFLEKKSTAEKEKLEAVFLHQLEELWKIKTCKKTPFEKFQKEFDGKFVYVHDLTSDKLIKILPPEEFNQTFYSRTFPNVTHQELKKLHKTNVIIFGASTGDIIAKFLSQFGIQITLIDPDVVDTSNLTRLFSSSLHQLAEKKVLQTGTDIIRNNPFTKITLYPRALKTAELEPLIQKLKKGGPLLIVDAMDDLYQKVQLRKIAKKNKVPVLMNTNLEYRAVITFEDHDTPDFVHPNSELKIDRSKDKKLKDTIKEVIQIIGTEHLPPRIMANFFLLLNQEIPYLFSQHGLNAGMGGGIVAKMIIRHALGQKVKDRVILNLHKIVGSTIEDRLASDKQLFEELCELYPQTFTQDHPAQTLLEKVKTMTQAEFETDYKFAYLY